MAGRPAMCPAEHSVYRQMGSMTDGNLQPPSKVHGVRGKRNKHNMMMLWKEINTPKHPNIVLILLEFVGATTAISS